jgi:hypothetical protein
MLSGTFASLHGLDIEACKQGIVDDPFSVPAGTPLPQPYSTISMADQVDAWRREHA